MPETAGWILRDFGVWIERWIATDSPDVDRILLVGLWAMSRADDPYVGARRVPEIPNLWFAGIPQTRRPDNTVMTCTYWIYEQERTVRCDMIQPLSLPIP